MERNQLLVTIAKSKLTRRCEDKNEKVTRPEELVRLYDLLLQVNSLTRLCIVNILLFIKRINSLLLFMMYFFAPGQVANLIIMLHLAEHIRSF